MVHTAQTRQESVTCFYSINEIYLQIRVNSKSDTQKVTICWAGPTYVGCIRTLKKGFSDSNGTSSMEVNGHCDQWRYSYSAKRTMETSNEVLSPSRSLKMQTSPTSKLLSFANSRQPFKIVAAQVLNLGDLILILTNHNPTLGTQRTTSS
ncbi:LOW QUALITY PROTEIN: hypothetical protein PanWU01x14_197930 [Parasponia andersonii]|uniref:Uncharacterized protein n=1 Tax=Parasponia andersonii TaxID=3476 RepID=A0A2P5BZ22_PARAD|nr:LOW QUALITY PROTEIN: hypothetical protein PanWU01x14_197930 [Parasponia andersonii]